jgi:hypothetical protein
MKIVTVEVDSSKEERLRQFLIDLELSFSETEEIETIPTAHQEHILALKGQAKSSDFISWKEMRANILKTNV